MKLDLERKQIDRYLRKERKYGEELSGKANSAIDLFNE